MASAEELIREAQFAFHNVGPGSTDEKRNRARAKKFAKRVLRRYPVSPEAQQARAILAQLDVEYAIAADTSAVSQKKHRLAPALSQSAAASEARTFVTQDGDSSWGHLWQLFSELPQLQKKVLLSVLTLFVLFVVFTPFLFVFLIILFVKRDAMRDLLHKVLVSMHPDAAKHRRRRKRTR
tara:strand:+ start:4167 stop:4706 length:540 start_codon:yes stop_codon:yes gene_type:complete